MSHRSRALAAVLLAGILGACTSTGVADQEAGTPTPSPSVAMPTLDPTPTSTAEEAPHPVSVQALIDANYDGRGLRIRRERGRTDAYTSYVVTYRSGDLTISGLLNVPHGDGPFPALVLAHGYIPPDEYSTGRGFERSQNYLARNGFVVLHTDYRNHAGSDDDPGNDASLRLGYVEDVINAVHALERSSLPSVDRERIGILGRSMGGGVALTVAVVRPDLADAIVVFAPISSDAVDNFERWINRPGRRELAQRIIERYGSPEANPSFWRDASARTYFDRVAVPIQIHHGTDDESVPIAWSEETLAALEAAGKDATLFTYEGEGHSFGAAYVPAMRRTVRFFEEHLG